MKRRWLRFLVTLAALVVVGLVLKYTAFRPVEIPVTVFRVARGTVEETVTNSKAGTVKSRRRAMLSPEIAGRIEELYVREGDRVEEGQALLRLAGEDYRAQVVLQERALDSARAVKREACLTTEHAEREYQRSLRLAQENIISQELIDRRQSERDVTAAACEAAAARAREAEAARDVAQVNLSKTVLYAPFDGIAAEVTTEVGEWISPSLPGIPVSAAVELIQTTTTYISAPLDEVDLGKVLAGQPVRATLDAYRGRSFPGRVVRVAPYVLDVEEHSRTFEIEVELEDRDLAATMLPGASADVEIILEARADVVRIPSYALIEGDHVFVVNDGTIVAQKVTPGLKNWDFTEVTSGLEVDELVVVSVDRIEVTEGARVRVAGETLK
jgi:HlyD family secretion protein